MSEPINAIDFLKRLKILPKIIENCELQKLNWKERAYSRTAGGESVNIYNEKTGEVERHNIEKVQASSSGDSMAVAVVSYVDIERKVKALKAEKEKAEIILEQLEPNHYDVLYKFYILEFRLYEIADSLNKSYSFVAKTRKKALKSLQTLLNCDK